MAKHSFAAAVAELQHPTAPSIAVYDAVSEREIRAAVARATSRRVLTASLGITDDVGARFVIPLLLPEEIESGDGRTFKTESLTLRELPLPLLWQIKTAEGHDGSVVVGRIDHIERTPAGMGNATGYFDTGHYGREAERLVRNQMLRFVSADLDQFEARSESTMTASNDDDDSDSDDSVIKAQPLTITKSRVMAATIVAKPAYQECKIMIVNDTNLDSFPDGEYTDAPALVAAAASSVATLTVTPDSLVDVPVFPPAEWFNDPKLSHATPLTVDRSGRVFGHIASWDQDHIGMPPGTRTPHSASNYAYFHTGSIECSDGTRVSVGQITLSGGHAPLSADAAAAVRHYDDTRSAMVDVHAGEDQFGIWVAGAVRPGVTQADLRAFSAAAPSGDWRSVRPGQLELVAVCQVNVPGFPVVRAQVASGAVMTLVAAGVQALASALDVSDEARRKIARLAAQRDQHRSQTLSAARARIDERTGYAAYQSLVASMAPDERARLTRRRVAMADGSYPVRNTAELQYAITASTRDAANVRLRCHTVRRARVLGAESLLPESWPERDMSPGQLLRQTYGLR